MEEVLIAAVFKREPLWNSSIKPQERAYTKKTVGRGCRGRSSGVIEYLNAVSFFCNLTFNIALQVVYSYVGMNETYRHIFAILCTNVRILFVEVLKG